MNCQTNERSVFSKPEVRGLLKQYHLVQLYTDRVPLEFYAPDVRADAEADPQRAKDDAKITNQWFQRGAFPRQAEQLPVYAILEPQPDGKVKVLDIYGEGLINNETGFKEFLRKYLPKGVKDADDKDDHRTASR